MKLILSVELGEIVMKKFFIGLFSAAMFLMQTAFAEIEVPENIYQWIDSTPRGNYFFNFRQTNYAVKDDGTIDLYTIIAPTITTYDNIQIDDVLQKRRWRGLSTANYTDLVGRADYLKFDLSIGTVQIIERNNIDSTFTSIDSEKNLHAKPLSSLSKNQVERKIYRTILLWAKKNNEVMIKRSRGHLSEKDSKLKPEDFPISKFDWIAD